jgi:SNF2 family DNA or RNA helicase
MHKDRHAAATMLARSMGAAKAMALGAPHVLTEGVPGLGFYLKGKLMGRKSTSDEVQNILRPDVVEMINKLPDSPTYQKAAAFRRPKFPYGPPGIKPKTEPVKDLPDFRKRLDEMKKRVETRLPPEQLELPGVKKADVDTELQPHQQRVVNKMMDPNLRGLIAAHGLGSGKTLTSIAVADALGMKADAVVPASLQDNYKKEITKHTSGKRPHIDVKSMQNVVGKQGQGLNNPLMIVDEAHRLRNPTKTQQVLASSPAQKRLLLTGSLFYNTPSDVAGPINMVAGRNTLPSQKSEFDRRFIRERIENDGFLAQLMGKDPKVITEINPKHRRELEHILHKYVDYHPGSTDNFPQRRDQTISVPMTPNQRNVYNTVMDQAPAWVREKVRAGLPPSKQEASQLNAFLSAARQVSNTTAPFQTKGSPSTPKIDRAVRELQDVLAKNPRAKALVYSNYLDAGVNPYKQRLQEAGVPYGEFTGEMAKPVRDQLVRDYNEDKLKALILSSAGGEGLDLKGTRLIQILEPHWNDEKLKQVIGRGIRYQSHEHLPEEERNVTVQRFISKHPKPGTLEKFFKGSPGRSVDEYLQGMSANKENLNEQFRSLLRS